jgi:hypothetical protein
MLDRRVALKMLRPELAREPGLVERFRSHARTNLPSPCSDAV